MKEINTTNNDISKKKPDETTRVVVSAHLVIKDKDTGNELVNKRG